MQHFIEEQRKYLYCHQSPFLRNTSWIWLPLEPSVHPRLHRSECGSCAKCRLKVFSNRYVLCIPLFMPPRILWWEPYLGQNWKEVLLASLDGHWLFKCQCILANHSHKRRKKNDGSYNYSHDWSVLIYHDVNSWINSQGNKRQPTILFIVDRRSS